LQSEPRTTSQNKGDNSLTRSGVTNLFLTESSLVEIHAKGYQLDTHTSEIKICSICLQLCCH